MNLNIAKLPHLGMRVIKQASPPLIVGSQATHYMWLSLLGWQDCSPTEDYLLGGIGPHPWDYFMTPSQLQCGHTYKCCAPGTRDPYCQCNNYWWDSCIYAASVYSIHQIGGDREGGVKLDVIADFLVAYDDMYQQKIGIEVDLSSLDAEHAYFTGHGRW